MNDHPFIMDHINLIVPIGRNSYAESAEVFRKMADWARENNITVILGEQKKPVQNVHFKKLRKLQLR